MAPSLPAEVLYMILDQLRDERDYNTIYQFALCSKYFTEPALTILYQLYDTAPVTGGGATEDEQIKARRTGGSVEDAKRQQERTIWKWAAMWRSVILSAIDQTYLPYCNYIRHLNLEDLSDLLSHSGFKDKTHDYFFTSELREAAGQHNWNRRLRSRSAQDFPLLVTGLGSAIIKNTNSIRGLSCNISTDTLSDWLEHLPSLQTLSIWDGGNLTQPVGNKIRNHCPQFKRITAYRWASNGPWHTEAESERFLNELRPHTLEHFEVISFNFLSSDSISGLSTHLSSLTELKLTSLGLNAIASLPSLTAPPALRALALTDSKVLVDNDLVDSIITRLGQWIHSCKALKELHIRRFVFDPNTLLSQALANGGPRLTTLSLSDYVASEARDFHETLGSQKTLQNLYLSGEGMEPVEDNVHLVQAFAELNEIRVLELKGVSNGFTQDHVMALVALIPRVERLWIDGDYFDDSIWLAFSCLSKLRSLVIQALSEFSEQAIISFVTKLKSGSHGFNLSIMNSVTEANLSEDAQKSIRDILIGGLFEFGLAQEEFSDMSSEEFSD
ncbi:uncharacterized protein ACHE_40582S [Aspergillus chevalieri]|uniref:F-box domain-containing protein n=1 Tax=Aspergillus chevalieri TaxID=182096 RepID=A0A7R7VNN7_ASPCH|nr:uncharacterized protein ACHE_40582S [Aspergillus chevalieri]BCR88018.1 hypothetical protein ACHE_40582S [Aspergillus chevalieri]